MLVIPGQMLAQHHLWERHQKASFLNKPIKWPTAGIFFFLFFYVAAVCRDSVFPVFWKDKLACLKEFCLKARLTGFDFKYVQNWDGRVHQAKHTFSDDINIQVGVSLYNLNQRIFVKSCQKFFPNISINPKRDLWTCQGDLALRDYFSPQLHLFKYRNMYVCVCARVCVLSQTVSARFSHSGEEDFIWLNGLSLSRQRLVRLQPQSVMWNNRGRPDQMCRADPGPVVGQRWG